MPLYKAPAHAPAYDPNVCAYRRLKYAFNGFNAKAMFTSFCDEMRSKYGIECTFDKEDPGSEIPAILAEQLMNTDGRSIFLKNEIKEIIYQKMRAENHHVDHTLMFGISEATSASSELSGPIPRDGKHELVMLHLVHTIRNCLKVHRHHMRKHQKFLRLERLGLCTPAEMAKIAVVPDVMQTVPEESNITNINDINAIHVGQKRKYQQDGTTRDNINENSEKEPRFIDSSEDDDEMETVNAEDMQEHQEQYHEACDERGQEVTGCCDEDRVFTLPEMREFFALDEVDLNMYDLCSYSLTRDSSGDAADASTGVRFDTFFGRQE